MNEFRTVLGKMEGQLLNNNYKQDIHFLLYIRFYISYIFWWSNLILICITSKLKRFVKSEIQTLYTHRTSVMLERHSTYVSFTFVDYPACDTLVSAWISHYVWLNLIHISLDFNLLRNFNKKSLIMKLFIFIYLIMIKI